MILFRDVELGRLFVFTGINDELSVLQKCSREEACAVRGVDPNTGKLRLSRKSVVGEFVKVQLINRRTFFG